MPIRTAALLFLAVGGALTARAERLDHTFVLTLNHSSGATLAIPPSISGLEVTAPTNENGSPLYEQSGSETTNPLYEGAADPGTPGSVIGVLFELDGPKVTNRDNVVHRDIAARNVRIVTTEGVYEADGVLSFQNDGPPSLRGVGPVRWMSPESIRTREYTPGAGDQRNGSWEIAAFSYFDVSYPVPEPTAAALVLMGLGAIGRRR